MRDVSRLQVTAKVNAGRNPRHTSSRPDPVQGSSIWIANRAAAVTIATSNPTRHERDSGGGEPLMTAPQGASAALALTTMVTVTFHFLPCLFSAPCLPLAKVS